MAATLPLGVCSGRDKAHFGDVTAVRVLGALRRLRQLLEQHEHVAAGLAQRNRHRFRIRANGALQRSTPIADLRGYRTVTGGENLNLVGRAGNGSSEGSDGCLTEI